MAAPAASLVVDRSARLADPSLHAGLRGFVRGRVPPGDVDDIVQTTLTDALAAADAPEAPEEFRRWVFGIARNKIADLFRRRSRQAEPTEGEEIATEDEGGSPLEARELLEWVDREIAHNEGARSTFEWMLREGDGDSLEEIAKDERLPAPRVRQRVSRLRRHLRSRYAVLVAGLAVLLAAGVAWLLTRRDANVDDPKKLIAKEQPIEPTPAQKARPIREAAFERCTRGAFRECQELLDRAQVLDPAGDADQRVQNARREAAEALTPKPAPSDTTKQLAPVPTQLPQESKYDDSAKKMAPRKPVRTAPMTKQPKKIDSGSLFDDNVMPEPSQVQKNLPIQNPAPQKPEPIEKK